MNTTRDSEIEFYQILGKLFYAIAASDKVVHKVEIETLKELIKTVWVPLDDYEDEFHEDAAYQIETVFDWLEYERIKQLPVLKNSNHLKKKMNLFLVIIEKS